MAGSMKIISRIGDNVYTESNTATESLK